MHPLHSGRRTSERALAAPDRVHCAEEADMRSHGCGCRSRCGPSTVSAVAFAALLVFTVTATFLRSHVYLSTAAAEFGRGERALNNARRPLPTFILLEISRSALYHCLQYRNSLCCPSMSFLSPPDPLPLYFLPKPTSSALIGPVLLVAIVWTRLQLLTGR